MYCLSQIFCQRISPISIRARCESQLAVWSSGLNVRWSWDGLSSSSFLAWSCIAQPICQWACSLLAIWFLKPWVRILHSAEEDKLSPFDSNIACLCQSIEISTIYILYSEITILVGTTDDVMPLRHFPHYCPWWRKSVVYSGDAPPVVAVALVGSFWISWIFINSVIPGSLLTLWFLDLY